MTIHQILDRFRAEASSSVDLGDKFERLIAAYLRIDPIYAECFDEVWLWSEWPDKTGYGRSEVFDYRNWTVSAQ